MVKNRPAIPRANRDAVLSEFNHRCAVCGRERPQVHHIDEDPSNNDPSNLIPLCPNCHLIDQHNPTRPIEPAKLRLFRQHKNPIILGPQFDPLFQRLRFLDDVQDDSPVRDLQAKAGELVSFVKALQMGDFYGRQVSRLVRKPARAEGTSVVGWGGSNPASGRRVIEDDQEYRQQLRSVCKQVYSLAVELLRYQPWEPPKQKGRDL